MALKPVRRCLLTIIVAGIVACGKDHPPAGPDLTLAATIAVSPDSLGLMINDTARVRAAVLNAEGDTLPDAPVSFLSSDTTVATIDASGLVQARAGGVSDVEVRSDTVTTTLVVRVRVNGTLVVSPRVAFLQAFDTLQLSFVVKDSNGSVVPNAPVQYRSFDTTVARVSTGGRVTFGGVAGSVMIQVTSVGRTDGALITAVVRRAPTGNAQLVAVRSGTAFTVTDGMLQRVDLATGAVTDEAFVGDRDYSDLEVNEGRTRAYLGNYEDGQVMVIDLIADTVGGYSIGPPYRGPWAIALPPGDSVLYFLADTALYRLRLGTSTTTPVMKCAGSQLITRDSLMYAICPGTFRSDLLEYNVLRRTIGRVLRSSEGVFDVQFSRNGQQLYVLGYQRLEVWSVLSGDSLSAIPAPLPATFGASVLEVQPTTGLLWMVNESGTRVLAVDPLVGVIRTLQTGGHVAAIGFGNSGDGLIVNAPGGYPATGWFDFVR